MSKRVDKSESFAEKQLRFEFMGEDAAVAPEPAEEQVETTEGRYVDENQLDLFDERKLLRNSVCKALLRLDFDGASTLIHEITDSSLSSDLKRRFSEVINYWGGITRLTDAPDPEIWADNWLLAMQAFVSSEVFKDIHLIEKTFVRALTTELLKAAPRLSRPDKYLAFAAEQGMYEEIVEVLRKMAADGRRASIYVSLGAAHKKLKNYKAGLMAYFSAFLLDSDGIDMDDVLDHHLWDCYDDCLEAGKDETTAKVLLPSLAVIKNIITFDEAEAVLSELFPPSAGGVKMTRAAELTKLVIDVCSKQRSAELEERIKQRRRLADGDPYLLKTLLG